MKKFIKLPFKYFYGGASYRVRVHIYLICILKKKEMTWFASFIARRLQKIQGVFISPEAQFDESISFRHPVGIVVGDGVKLGKNVILYQNTTLGGARLGDAELGNYPTIGDNTVIFAGAVIVGKIVVGKNCTIGANAVVTSDIPDGCVAVGSPARIIRKK